MCIIVRLIQCMSIIFLGNGERKEGLQIVVAWGQGVLRFMKPPFEEEGHGCVTPFGVINKITHIIASLPVTSLLLYKIQNFHVTTNSQTLPPPCTYTKTSLELGFRGVRRGYWTSGSIRGQHKTSISTIFSLFTLSAWRLG